MSVIAAYYGLPTLSVRAAVFHLMLQNQHGYRVRQRGGGRAASGAKGVRLGGWVPYVAGELEDGADGRCAWPLI